MFTWLEFGVYGEKVKFRSRLRMAMSIDRPDLTTSSGITLALEYCTAMLGVASWGIACAVRDQAVSSSFAMAPESSMPIEPSCC